VLHELLAHPDSYNLPDEDLRKLLSHPIHCLVITEGMAQDAASWKNLIDAGILPLLCDLIELCSEELMEDLMQLVNSLVMMSPEEGGREYLGRLPSVIVGLITAEPPVAPHLATDALLNMALFCEELVSDFQSWGITPILKGLKTRHNDLRVRSAADGLMRNMRLGS
jgi:hypothetical protein